MCHPSTAPPLPPTMSAWGHEPPESPSRKSRVHHSLPAPPSFLCWASWRGQEMGSTRLTTGRQADATSSSQNERQPSQSNQPPPPWSWPWSRVVDLVLGRVRVRVLVCPVALVSRSCGLGVLQRCTATATAAATATAGCCHCQASPSACLSGDAPQREDERYVQVHVPFDVRGTTCTGTLHYIASLH